MSNTTHIAETVDLRLNESLRRAAAGRRALTTGIYAGIKLAAVATVSKEYLRGLADGTDDHDLARDIRTILEVLK